MNVLGQEKDLLRSARDLASQLPGGYAYAVDMRRVELPADPLVHFAEHAGRGRSLYWHGRGWLLAVGSCQDISASGPGRTFHLAESRSALQTRMVCRGGEPPLLVRLAFEDRPGPPGTWGRSLPGAHLLLPRRCWWRRSDGSCWEMNALRLTGADTELDDARLLEEALPEIDADTTTPWGGLALPDYEELVGNAVGLLEHGGLRKVVLARAVDEELPAPVKPVDVLAHLQDHADEHTYVYAQDLDDASCFVGATPELLYHLEDRRLTALSLAGSRPRGEDAANDARLAEELVASTKERKEHQLVVEHISRQLRHRSEALTVPATPSIRRLARLQHLETVIRATLTEPDPFDILNALQPTPAVAGLPTDAAVDWIRRHEGLHRGLYTGSLGVLHGSEGRFIVPLRGGVVRERRARLFAGAGIVETSEPAAELAETELKLRPMRQALGIE